jgi:hypothetical protein
MVQKHVFKFPRREFSRYMQCKGICKKYHEKHSPWTGGRYEAGHKRCSCCEVFIKFDGKQCPCCGTNLRGKPRNSQARNKIVESSKN